MVFTGGTQNKNEAERRRGRLYVTLTPQKSTKQPGRPTAAVTGQSRPFVQSFNKHSWSACDVPDRSEDENTSAVLLHCKISPRKWHFQDHLLWLSRLWLPGMLHVPPALRYEGCRPRDRILKSKGLGPRTHGLFHPPHFTTVLLRSFIKSLQWAMFPVTPVHCTRQSYFLRLTFVRIIKRGLIKLKNKVYFHLCVWERHMDGVETWKRGTDIHRSRRTQNASSFQRSHWLSKQGLYLSAGCGSRPTRNQGWEAWNPLSVKESPPARAQAGARSGRNKPGP